ncbi:hypothetical protein OAQ99_04965 [Candidatus Kapabacteria bacterium]|nr:hypothetical protein [Candidatus Kapabacteria bacterium]
MRSIIVTMRTQEGEEVVREIDISNFAVSHGEYDMIETDPENQLVILNDWIKKRANAQHDTRLTLINWYTI